MALDNRQATFLEPSISRIAKQFVVAGPLEATTFIQRLNTSGGIAPSTGCVADLDIGKKALVPYTADYFFYKAADNE